MSYVVHMQVQKCSVATHERNQPWLHRNACFIVEGNKKRKKENKKDFKCFAGFELKHTQQQASLLCQKAWSDDYRSYDTIMGVAMRLTVFQCLQDVLIPSHPQPHIA